MRLVEILETVEKSLNLLLLVWWQSHVDQAVFIGPETLEFVIRNLSVSIRVDSPAEESKIKKLPQPCNILTQMQSWTLCQTENTLSPRWTLWILPHLRNHQNPIANVISEMTSTFPCWEATAMKNLVPCRTFGRWAMTEGNGLDQGGQRSSVPPRAICLSFCSSPTQCTLACPFLKVVLKLRNSKWYTKCSTHPPTRFLLQQGQKVSLKLVLLSCFFCEVGVTASKLSVETNNVIVGPVVKLTLSCWQ